MNRINTPSPYLAPGIRAAALAVLLFAVLGPQPTAARPVAVAYAEAAAWLRAEAVGWAEWNESHHDEAAALRSWDSLRSAHPTRYAEPGHAVVATIDGVGLPGASPRGVLLRGRRRESAN